MDFENKESVEDIDLNIDLDIVDNLVEGSTDYKDWAVLLVNKYYFFRVILPFESFYH